KSARGLAHSKTWRSSLECGFELDPRENVSLYWVAGLGGILKGKYTDKTVEGQTMRSFFLYSSQPLPDKLILGPGHAPNDNTVFFSSSSPIEDVWRKVLEQVPYGDGALIVLCSLDGEGVRRKSGDPLVEKFFNDRPQLSSGGTGANA